VLDNASFHNKKRLHLLAQKYGHKIIFLPPYSSELNPIEKFWSWLKGKLKKVLRDFDCLLCVTVLMLFDYNAISPPCTSRNGSSKKSD
jgi:putative transposase